MGEILTGTFPCHDLEEHSTRHLRQRHREYICSTENPRRPCKDWIPWDQGENSKNPPRSLLTGFCSGPTFSRHLKRHLSPKMDSGRCLFHRRNVQYSQSQLCMRSSSLSRHSCLSSRTLHSIPPNSAGILIPWTIRSWLVTFDTILD